MLRKRSRAVSSGKQTLICDHKNNFQAPNPEKSHKPNSFLTNSPRFIKDLFSPKQSGGESIMSPSSVLDTKPLSSSYKIQNPKALSSAKKHSWEQPAIGLALIDDPEIGPTKSSKQRSKLVVFGSHLKIQIPTPPPPPKSAMEFGIKTPKTNLLGHVLVNSVLEQEEPIEDMEMSEDYTCVISHGPNPKTTHIFGNCIVKSKDFASSTNRKAQFTTTTQRLSYGKAEREVASQEKRFSNTHENSSFLSFCHHCNKKIGQGYDIYMYRGEKAFCSQECRGQEMLFDGMEC